VLRTAGAIKRRVKPGLGFKSCRTAWRTIDGYEALNQLRKGQVQGTTKGDIRSQNEFIARAFGLAASYQDIRRSAPITTSVLGSLNRCNGTQTLALDRSPAVFTS
jgi:hypothetical protein